MSEDHARKRRIPEITEITLKDIHYGFEHEQFTSAILVKTYMDRINEAQEEFKAVLEVNPDALAIAESLDIEYQAGQVRGPLHGVPILLKDNMATDDSMETTAASTILLGSKPGYDADIVKRLRDAGAVILGKANMAEFAGWTPFVKSGNWSPRGGQCKGAYREDMEAGVSSCGSAVATALGLCFASIGTETNGSIAVPSSRNAVVGIRPSVGLVSSHGVIPIRREQDSAGPIARCVSDAVQILDVLGDLKYRVPSQDDTLDGISIGIPTNTFPNDIQQYVLDTFEEALSTLSKAGARIVKNANYAGIDEYNRLLTRFSGIVLGGGFKRDIIPYLSSLKHNPRNLYNIDDLLAAAKKSPIESKHGFARWEKSANTEIDSDEYQAALKWFHYLAGEGGLIGALETYNLDLVATPTVAGMCLHSGSMGGYPNITVPLGWYPENTEITMGKGQAYKPLIEIGPGVPFAMLFIGPPGSEELLIKVAHVFEQMTQVRARIPTYHVPRTQLPGYIHQTDKSIEVESTREPLREEVTKRKHRSCTDLILRPFQSRAWMDPQDDRPSHSFDDEEKTDLTDVKWDTYKD